MNKFKSIVLLSLISSQVGVSAEDAAIHGPRGENLPAGYMQVALGGKQLEKELIVKDQRITKLEREIEQMQQQLTAKDKRNLQAMGEVEKLNKELIVKNQKIAELAKNNSDLRKKNAKSEENFGIERLAHYDYLDKYRCACERVKELQEGQQASDQQGSAQNIADFRKELEVAQQETADLRKQLVVSQQGKADFLRQLVVARQETATFRTQLGETKQNAAGFLKKLEVVQRETTSLLKQLTGQGSGQQGEGE